MTNRKVGLWPPLRLINTQQTDLTRQTGEKCPVPLTFSPNADQAVQPSTSGSDTRTGQCNQQAARGTRPMESDDLIFTKDDEGELTPIEYASQRRERPRLRRHETYDKDHWETAHIDRVDKIGAFESPTFGDGPIRSRETIRVDLDGFGHGMASMHGFDVNIQCSFWLTPDRARELYEQLGEQLLDQVTDDE